MNSQKLTEIELEHVHWWSLERRLPVEGVERYFRTDKDRRERFIKVRWPGGPACIKCGSGNLGIVETRAVFQCKECRHQFSPTTGSILHRSRVDLAIWFRAAEMIICEGDAGFSEYSRRYRMPSQTLGDRLGVDYVAAHRLRKILLADMGRGGAGLMSEVICISPSGIPAGIVPHTLAHFDWLLAERSPPSTDEDLLRILMQ